MHNFDPYFEAAIINAKILNKSKGYPQQEFALMYIRMGLVINRV